MAYRTNAQLEAELAKAQKDYLGFRGTRVWAVALTCMVALSVTALVVAWVINTSNNNHRIVQIAQIQKEK